MNVLLTLVNKLYLLTYLLTYLLIYLLTAETLFPLCLLNINLNVFTAITYQYGVAKPELGALVVDRGGGDGEQLNW